MANLAALLIFSSLLALASADPYFVITGKVYCDNCRAGFETHATQYIQGAQVKLECRHFNNHTIVHTAYGVTDTTGTYAITVLDDHQEEICEVVLVDSPLDGCREVVKGRERARVLLTHDNGISSKVRYANSLGFLKEKPLPICGELLRQYALNDEY